MYKTVLGGGCALHFRKGEARVPLKRGWSRTRMPPGSGNLALVLRSLCTDLAFTMEPTHFLRSRCEFDLFFEGTAVFVACVVARRVLLWCGFDLCFEDPTMCVVCIVARRVIFST